MIKETLYPAEVARPRLMKGVKKVADAVGSTMGTAGQNGLIEDMRLPGYLPTNDGFTMANAIHLEDPLENMGRRILIEAINKANKASGDGSSTTCVLTAAILEEGMKHVGEVSPMEIKRSLEACVPIIEKSIKEQTKKITVDDVHEVASVSAEDEEIGATIQEIYHKIGKEGIVSLDVSKTGEDHYEIGTGITIHDAKYVSPYMCDMANTGLLTKVTMENPLILLARKKITVAQEVDDLSLALQQSGLTEFIIFAEDIDVTLVNSFIALRQMKGFRIVVVKMPVLWADEWWEDLAFATGATVIGANSGIKLHNVRREHLGTCAHITVDKENTYLDGIQDLTKIPQKTGGKDMIYDHIGALKADWSESALVRAARLNTKTARYFVGAQSEGALAYRRLKIEDSVNAAAVALENGVVCGGGKTLYNAINELSRCGIGGKILSVALQAPFRKIIENTGLDVEKVIKDIEN